MHSDVHITWDEPTIAEHDKLRGTRQKIDEPSTPYHYGSGESSTGSDCESAGTADRCVGTCCACAGTVGQRVNRCFFFSVCILWRNQTFVAVGTYVSYAVRT